MFDFPNSATRFSGGFSSSTSSNFIFTQNESLSQSDVTVSTQRKAKLTSPGIVFTTIRAICNRSFEDRPTVIGDDDEHHNSPTPSASSSALLFAVVGFILQFTSESNSITGRFFDGTGVLDFECFVHETWRMDLLSELMRLSSLSGEDGEGCIPQCSIRLVGSKSSSAEKLMVVGLAKCSLGEYMCGHPLFVCCGHFRNPPSNNDSTASFGEYATGDEPSVGLGDINLSGGKPCEDGSSKGGASSSSDDYFNNEEIEIPACHRGDVGEKRLAKVLFKLIETKSDKIGMSLTKIRKELSSLYSISEIKSEIDRLENLEVLMCTVGDYYAIV